MNFNDIGFELHDNILSAGECVNLLSILNQHKLQPLTGGIRRIEQLVPEVAALAQSQKLRALASNYLSSKPALVRAIYFDKSAENNWLVTWHQDRTVAVTDKFEAEGWGLWSRKADAWHVQPPLEVLENMITIRISLDASDRNNGCLKFLAGSHKVGIIKSTEMPVYTKDKAAIYCETPVGSALVMRPHIVHASEKALTQAPRRVLHFEYAGYVLPDGIKWAA